MTKSSEKYLFNRPFETRLSSPSWQDLDAARIESYQQGFQSGQDELMGQITAKTSQVLENIVSDLEILLERQNRSYEYLTKHIMDVSKAIFSALLPHMMKNGALEEVKAFVTDVINDLKPTGTLNIQVHGDILSPLTKSLDTIIESLAPQGTIHVSNDPDMQITDCRLSWDDGGIERITNIAIKNIETALDRIGYGLAPNSSNPAEDLSHQKEADDARREE